MRLPNTAHESRGWRIREIAPGFTVEDVWAPPVHGGAADFHSLLEVMVSLDPAHGGSLPNRVLWRVRDRLGSWFDLGRVSAAIDSGRDDAAGELPISGTKRDLADRAAAGRTAQLGGGSAFGSTPFTPLYRTDDEFAAELSNQTVHGVMHLACVDRGRGRYQGQMAVYLKPRGLLGRGYMAFIKPFRHWVVYQGTHETDRTGVERTRSSRPAPGLGVPDVTLPPGQRRIDGFPRFGTHLSRPAPAVPTNPIIAIRGAVTAPFDLATDQAGDTSPARAHRRLPLRGRLVRDEPSLDVPAWSVRPFYRAFIAPITFLSARGSREARNRQPPQ